MITEPNNSSSVNAIAIVGMSCRFPHADSPDAFWELLSNGKDTIEEISKERWNADAFYDPDPAAERKTYQRHASLLSNIHDFDPLFFNISPAEAIEMSPSQKLMLELSWEAIEGSTVPFRRIKGRNVGVYVGNIWSDFEHFRRFKNAKPTLHSAVGMSSSVVANRVSFALGLTGPSLVIDTGCSSSLVALHYACESLSTGECEMAIAGGINHILDPGKYIELTTFGGLSMKGRCSSFDADADGFVRGEGGGVLLLKRLSDAERDGDKILAVIRGTAVNNNGFNDTLPATSTEGQLSMLDKAYRMAGIKPHEVHYVEAHGTGTKLGDPNEARALGQFFRQGRTGKKLHIGSVKTNLGHTEATAGIAGLIKVVLAMQHQLLPPNLNFKTPNANIEFDDLKLQVQNTLSGWPVNNSETFKAGINSFGWGGTNAHAVVEQYISKKDEKFSISTSTVLCLPLSAKSSQALTDYAKLYVKKFEEADEETCRAICVATALGKTEFDHRRIFAGNSREEIIQELNSFIQENIEVTPQQAVTEKDKIVFVFPGQGAQWLGMGRDLFVKERVFREAILECDHAFRPFTDWSLIDQLNAEPEKSRLQEIDVIQPSICAMQIALAKLWLSWGIRPQAVVGHSMGEVAAAHISGAITLQDAARIICTRSRLMKTVSGKGGAMAVTELTREEAQKVVADYAGKISVAVNNSPKSTVLAGDKNSIDEVLAQLESKGLFCRLVKVDVASHSPQMDPLKEPLRVQLQDVKPQPTCIPFVSTVFNQVMDGVTLDADYWVSNLRGTVQFASVIQQLLADEHTIFIEANPHPVLVNAVNECAEHSRIKIINIASTVREKAEQKELLKNLNELYSKGYSVPWHLFYGTAVFPGVALPIYPFQRERYEIEDLSNELEMSTDTPAKYPLLGNKIELAGISNTFFWESIVSLNKFPYLKEHLINHKIELPASCYIELILEAMSEIFKGDISVRIEDVVFLKHFIFGEDDRIEMQVKLMVQDFDKAEVHVYKRRTGGSSWVELAYARACIADSNENIQAIFENLEYQGPSYTEGLNYYNLLKKIGFDYGRHFLSITGIDQVNPNSNNQILFSIKPDQGICLASGKYKIHPALINSFLHPLFGQLISILEEGNYLQVEFNKIQKVQMEGPIKCDRELHGLLILNTLIKTDPVSYSWSFNADIIIANHDNTPVMTFRGLQGTAGRTAPAKQVTDIQAAGSDIVLKFSEMQSETERAAVLQDILTQEVSKIIKISPSRIKASMTFKGMGLDSLMAVQLRNALEKNFNVKLSVGMFWTHPSIQDYAIYLGNILHEQMYGNTNVADKVAKEKNWFTISRPNPDAAIRVFCFHDAGGSASLFDGMETFFDSSSVELILVEMPGRGRRLEEAPFTETKPFVDDIIPALKPLLNKPYVFLGHSMGGLLAFEIIRELRRTNEALPEKLFISSTSGLNAYDKSQVDYTLSNDELVQLYPHLDISIIGDAELQGLLINILRSDLQFLYSHQYTAEAPLDIPIVAIHGSEDQRVKRHQIEQWANETQVSFKLISRSGGHRYIEHDREFVAKLIMEEMEFAAVRKS